MRLAALFVLLSVLPLRAQEDRWDARVVSAKGDVVVRPADGSAESGAGEDMPLEEGDRIVTGEDGSAEVSLDGTTLITVNESSELVIERTKKADSWLSLVAGSILAKIQKLGENRLSVRTPAAVAAVRGTDLGVEVEGDESHFGVFDEGKVEVTGAGATELLISNQETSVVEGGKPAHAAQLKRFVRRRALMRAHARRVAAVRARWKAIPPGERMRIRKERIEKFREKRKAFLQKADDKRRQVDVRDAERKRKADEARRKNKERMDKARSKAMQRRRGGQP